MAEHVGHPAEDRRERRHRQQVGNGDPAHARQPRVEGRRAARQTLHGVEHGVARGLTEDEARTLVERMIHVVLADLADRRVDRAPR